MSNKQYISFCFTGHDANISVYSEKLNKFYHFELERIFGLRYFIMENFSDSQKTYILQYIKNIILSLGFEACCLYISPGVLPSENLPVL